MHAEGQLPSGSPRAALIVWVCGLMAGTLGAIAMLGWHIENLPLVRLWPGLPLTAYFSALCFVLSGLGLAAYARGWPRLWPLSCGMLVGVLGWAWCLEHFFGWRLGVEKLEGLFPTIPGFGLVKPAPVATACFGLLGLAIAVLGASTSVTFKRLTTWTCGALALGPYALVLGSYATGFLRIDEWNNENVRAVYTIMGVTFLGIGLFATQFMNGPRLVDDVLLPLPVLLIVAATTVIYWLALATQRAHAPATVGHNLPLVTLVLGFLLAAALAVAVRAFQQIAWKKREIHAANQQLERFANEDHLTGLFNRRYFDQLLETEIRRAQRGGRNVAVIMADIDFFKRYNDLYGHPAGDECLRRVAAVFQAAARRPTDIVGRYGGEEFCAVLAEINASGARELAERVRVALEALGLPHASNPPGCVTASFGVASMDFSAGQPVDPEPAKRLIAQADAALYSAKEAGRNTVR